MSTEAPTSQSTSAPTTTPTPLFGTKQWAEEQFEKWKVPLCGFIFLFLLVAFAQLYRHRQKLKKDREDKHDRSTVTVRDGQVSIKVKRKQTMTQKRKPTAVRRLQQFQQETEELQTPDIRVSLHEGFVRLTVSNVTINARVQRGEHWRKADQDGGLGSVGTVRAFTKADGYLVAPDHLRQKLPAFPGLTCCVMWDHGKSAFYPMGANNEYALALVSSEQSNMVRMDTNRKLSVLDGRKQSILERFRAHQRSETNSGQRSLNRENAKIGIRVCRGKDWGYQDDSMGTAGTLLAIKYEVASGLQSVSTTAKLLSQLSSLPDGDFALVQWDQPSDVTRMRETNHKAFVYPLSKIAMLSTPVSANSLDAALDHSNDVRENQCAKEDDFMHESQVPPAIDDEIKYQQNHTSDDDKEGDYDY